MKATVPYIPSLSISTLQDNERSRGCSDSTRPILRLNFHGGRKASTRPPAGYEQELLDAGDQLVPYLAQQAQAAPTRGRAA